MKKKVSLYIAMLAIGTIMGILPGTANAIARKIPLAEIAAICTNSNQVNCDRCVEAYCAAYGTQSMQCELSLTGCCQSLADCIYTTG